MRSVWRRAWESAPRRSEPSRLLLCPQPLRLLQAPHAHDRKRRLHARLQGWSLGHGHTLQSGRLARFPSTNHRPFQGQDLDSLCSRDDRSPCRCPACTARRSTTRSARARLPSTPARLRSALRLCAEIIPPQPPPSTATLAETGASLCWRRECLTWLGSRRTSLI